MRHDQYRLNALKITNIIFLQSNQKQLKYIV